jgi:cytochrome c biogenesis protein CcmG/thiol:disulfide interchange protein DsbE
MRISTPQLRRYYLLLAALATLLIILGCNRLAAAPDFQVTRFDGGSFQLSELTGQEAVVINFWYPSCPPCREEMPHFEAVWQDMQGQETGGKDVRFLGLFVPQGFDTEQDARDFVAELGLTFDFATDLQALISQTYEVQYFPTTYFINKKGRVFQQEISNLDREGLTAIVSQMTEG